MAVHRRSDTGPDIVITGAARCGTSYLAARLAAHPDIDAAAVKEPNYFSRHFERGADWYDGLFSPRRDGLLRLDASTSYTYPQHQEALRRLASASPTARLIYCVRDPLERAMSHYWLYHRYFGFEKAESFGKAVESNDIYAGTSDYARWITGMCQLFPSEHVFVVPFAAVTTDELALASICDNLLGLPPPPLTRSADEHQNQVVTFRNESLRRWSRRLRRSRFYPTVRRRLGPERLRRIRKAVTRDVPKPSFAAMWNSCSAEQRDRLSALTTEANAAVHDHLARQDERTGLSFAEVWTEGQRGRLSQDGS